MDRPLAERMRPTCIDDVVGQSHLIGNGKILKNIINSEKISNMIFCGPPGTGKTTIAKIIAKKTNKTLSKLNGTTASTSDIRDVIEKVGTFAATNGVLLYLDEIQYFNKKQQQTLLEFIETGKITLIASTTENPYFSIYNAILSRCMVFEFKPVESKDIEKAIRRGIAFLEEEQDEKIHMSDKTITDISVLCGGDVRKALTFLETVCIASKSENGEKFVVNDIMDNFGTSHFSRYNKDGDEYYGLLSAFQKSLRGSDPQAGIYYLSRLLLFGDLISVCRRLLVCACEDVGLAYPSVIPIVKSCTDIAMQVGLPEAKIPLADAVLLVCLAPKSNSAYMAVNMAYSDLENGTLPEIPYYLKQTPIKSTDDRQLRKEYVYPHNKKGHWVKQTYLPEEIKDNVYFEFGDNKNEQAFKSYWSNLKGNIF